MKYLIRKDLSYLLKPPVWIVLLTNIFLWDFVSKPLESIAFAGPALAFQFILLITVYDSGRKNEMFINSLPIQRTTIVHSKFLASLVFIGLGYLLAFVIELPVFLMKGFHLFTFSYPMFVHGIGFWLILIAVFLFVHFMANNGNPEISLGYSLAFSILFAVVMLFLFRIGHLHNAAVVSSLIFHLILLVAVVIYAFAYLFSLRNYQHRDIKN